MMIANGISEQKYFGINYFISLYIVNDNIGSGINA